MADLWSLGVCFYEFMCGSMPYGDVNFYKFFITKKKKDCNDPFDIYQSILKKKV